MCFPHCNPIDIRHASLYQRFLLLLKNIVHDGIVRVISFPLLIFKMGQEGYNMLVLAGLPGSSDKGMWLWL